MKRNRLVVLLALVAVCDLAATASAANGRIGLHVIRLEPQGSDAERFSKANWGGGIEAVVAPPGVWNLLAFGIGFEGVHMNDQTTVFIDKVTQLRVEQQTSQDYFRVHLGARVGHQGHGFFRPYAGANLALNIFNVSTDVVVPDDSDRENEIRQNLESNTESAFGFDGVAGVELNFNDKWYLDFGAKYIKAFKVPQQLGEDADTIYPEYLEFYAGGGVTFALLEGQSE